MSLVRAACLAVLAFAAGCGAPAGARQAFRIAVIPKGTSHDFWKYIHAGAAAAVAERPGARILWDGPAKEDQRDVQQHIVERFTSEGVSAIVLAPCDRGTLVAPVEAALGQGIPVVIMDSGLELSEAIRASDKYLGYVATDNRQGGVEAARRMIALLNNKKAAKVLMLRYQAGSESTEQREAGFRDTIRNAPSIDFVEASDEAGATVTSAQKVAERILTDRKDLDGIFVPNESSTMGVLRALEVLKREGQVKLVGFDSNPDLMSALESDKIHGLVLQDPFGMAGQAVKRAIDYLEGKVLSPDKTLYTRLTVVTKENMKDPDVLPLYARDLKPYLGE